LLLDLLSELLLFELSLFELLLVLAVAVGAVSELDPALELALELLEPESESELVSLFALVPEVLSSVALSFDSDSELSATTGSLAEAISALISDSSVAKLLSSLCNSAFIAVKSASLSSSCCLFRSEEHTSELQ